jgi:hypothetical protein
MIVLTLAYASLVVALDLLFSYLRGLARSVEAEQKRSRRIGIELRTVVDELSVLRLRMDDLAAYRSTPLVGPGDSARDPHFAKRVNDRGEVDGN